MTCTCGHAKDAHAKHGWCWILHCGCARFVPMLTASPSLKSVNPVDVRVA